MQIKQKLIDLLQDLTGLSPAFNIPPTEAMGDFSTAIAMAWAKKLKKSPKELAEELKIKLDAERIPGIAAIAITPPGYLNFKFDKSYLAETIISQILDRKSDFGKIDLGQNRTALIEYSSPNTNKPLHIGHLRNNFIGMALCRILEKADYKVVGADLINDRGIHICKSMLAYQKWGKDKTPESEGIKDDKFVGNFYVMFEKELQKEKEAYCTLQDIDVDKLTEKEKEKLDKEFYHESKLYREALDMLKKWEDGDEKVMALWQKMNSWVYEGFEATYKTIGSQFDKHYYESETYLLGKEIVLDALKKGKCERQEDGAIIIDLRDKKLDKKVLIRADGTSVYVTQDLGVAKLKKDDFKPDFSYYIVGAEQIHHFQVLFAVLEKFGFNIHGLKHLVYGLVNLPEGKMKSREGKVVDADDLIAEMMRLASERTKDKDRAGDIALAAIKYHFLRVERGKDILYNPKESLALEGETGPYLQYMGARIIGIIRKLKVKSLKLKVAVQNLKLLQEKEEFELVKKLAEYPDIICDAAETLEPAILAHFLFDLAQTFNKFYENCPVIQAKDEIKSARLALIESARIVLSDGLQLLGIKALDKM